MAAKSNEIKIVRVYDAPVKLVWDAWTDPQQVGKWWGPRGFTLTTHSKELKVGGIWHYTMHGPDGTDYENKTLYHEVEKHRRLVYDHGGNDERAPLFRVTVNFKEAQGKTIMDMTMALATAEAAAETRKFIKKAGGDSTWDRLAEYLGKEIQHQEIFVINRSFNASIELMYDLWSNADHFKQWLPPAGFTMEFLSADIKRGGSSFYCMSNGEGVKMYGKAHYLEMQRPNRMVYTQEFSNPDGTISRHPFSPSWPAQMLTQVCFTEEDSGQTRVTVTWLPYGETTAAELETFLNARSGMTQGWTGSFDKLEDYLAHR